MCAKKVRLRLAAPLSCLVHVRTAELDRKLYDPGFRASVPIECANGCNYSYDVLSQT